jgi:hypothetical protein
MTEMESEALSQQRACQISEPSRLMLDYNLVDHQAKSFRYYVALFFCVYHLFQQSLFRSVADRANYLRPDAMRSAAIQSIKAHAVASCTFGSIKS